jgi:hypothetical protein
MYVNSRVLPQTKNCSLTVFKVVLSDMSAPWQQTSGYNVNTLSNPYHRLMNTSGIPFHDHARSLVGSFIECFDETIRAIQQTSLLITDGESAKRIFAMPPSILQVTL